MRLALLEAFTDADTLTATEAGERVGRAPQTPRFTCVSWRSTASSRRPKAGPVAAALEAQAQGVHFSDVHDDPEIAGRLGHWVGRCVRATWPGRSARWRKTADLPEGAEHVEILAMSYRL